MFRFGTTSVLIASTFVALLAAPAPGPAAALGAPSVHRAERAAHKHPRRIDSDHDGLTNWFERHRSHTDPHRRDTDRDGLSDGYEVRVSKTNPRRRDTDGDGYSDRREIRAGSNPRDPRSVPGGGRRESGGGAPSGSVAPLVSAPEATLPTPALPAPAPPAPPTTEEGEGTPESPEGEPPGEEPLPEEPPPASGSHCFAQPHLCGYPDPTNTGVPAGTTLTPSGSIVASTPGQTISARDVTGTIDVTADDVTIEDTRVTQTDTCGTVDTCGNYAIRIDEGVSGTTIRDVETRSEAGRTCEHDIRNTSASPVTIERAYLHACDSDLYGTATLKDSYGIAKIAISTDHVENVYVCGTTIDVEHSTLFNPVDQTAVVFGDALCGANRYTVRNSLLAGGGYVFYPQANAAPTSGQTIITGNHIARCLSAETPAKSGGNWLCNNGADSGGYYPRGGSFGIGAFFSGPLTWSGNVWDDSLSPLCSDGSPGCA